MRFVALGIAFAVGCAAALAEDAEAPKAARHHPRHKAGAHEGANVDLASVLDRPLRLNGRSGQLLLARADDGGGLRIAKLTLLGEVVSKPAQTCRIDIVADKPIAAEAKGEPDGLERFSADIPACPFSFDVVDGGVVVPPQANACVFTAADCQASPSGLWGAAAADLDAKAVKKVRADADRSIQDSLRALERRDADAAASLSREESDFAAERDETCQAYAEEKKVGFCASRLAQSRAALLAKRVAEAGPAKASTKPGKARKRKE